MPTNRLTALADWFARHCDGEREHHHGISIQSTDNPGWWIKIGLAGTPLATRPFPPISEGVGPDRHPVAARWIDCRVQNGQWDGVGDETRLAELVSRFLDRAERP